MLLAHRQGRSPRVSLLTSSIYRQRIICSTEISSRKQAINAVAFPNTVLSNRKSLPRLIRSAKFGGYGRWAAGIGLRNVLEQQFQQALVVARSNAVIVAFAIPSRFNNSGVSQHTKMVAYRRLALHQKVAKCTHMQLFCLRQTKQNPKPGFV